jgi:hypothetical protein
MNKGNRTTIEWLSTDHPTETAFANLEDWVIWQYPRLKRGWLCGAVHPPFSEYGWLPASIQPHRQRVLIHAHRTKSFSTPEEAAEWLAAEP